LLIKESLERKPISRSGLPIAAGRLTADASGAVRIGTAGWAIASRYAAEFALAGTHLQRYASRLNAVEINSSFYRPHRRQTYERWADSVPEDFCFAVKVPREITHECALTECTAPLDRFSEEVRGLGSRLGVILVQLPPSLAFESACAAAFFDAVRIRFEPHTGIACEPRHRSWFTVQADRLLRAGKIARVAADPPRAAGDGEPGGWRSLAYYRLHGAPRIYYSDYGTEILKCLGRKLAAQRLQAAATWCIFDNTAAQAALGNALSVRRVAPDAI
jgi:uncharacterized protein YecE (DUF72 family)